MHTSTTRSSTTFITIAGKKRLRNNTTQQKRNNVFVMKNMRKSAFALIIAVATTTLSPTVTRAFHVPRSTNSQHVTVLHSTRAPTRRSRTTTIKSSSASSSSIGVVEAVQPLRPESSMSQKRRDAVLRESRENNVATGMRSVDSALEGIDAQVLELLSEEFLYPSSSSSNSNNNINNKYSDPNKLSNERPYGRPELVPGAMTWSSMKRYQQKREIMNHLVDRAKEKSSTTTTASNRNLNSSISAANIIRHDLQPRLNVPSREVSRRATSAKSKKASASIRGSSSSSTSRRRKSKTATAATTTNIELPEATTTTTSTGGTDKKKVARKSKNKKKILPKQRKVKTSIEKENDIYYDDDEVYRANDPNKFIASRARPGRRKLDASVNGQGGETNNLELRKYYATDLLTPEQEYSIGQKIQLMISCEQVHEGLAIFESRLPTIEEWANACGYINERNEGDDNNEIINDLVEKQIRPIGSESIFKKIDPNMFVGNGLAHTVGVGRGRGRAKLPPPMKLTEDVYKLDRKTGTKVGGSKAKPVNRGTVHDFVDMILDGREAKQLMVQSNMRLVLSIARKYTKVGVSLQDLVQEGSLGLSRAAEKFDPTRGFKFSTYASWWIQQAVFRSIAYHSRIIRLPVHIHNMMNRVRKVKTNLQQGLGRAPTDEEMADALDMPTSKFKRMIRLTRRSISLEQPQYKQNPKDHGHEGDDSIGDMMSTGTDFGNNLDEENVSPEKSVDRSLFHQDLSEMLLNLNEGEQKVIGLRYGLEDGITRTVTAVATKINRTPAWVRSQESKGLRRLRRPWYEKKLLEHQQSLLQN